MRIANTLVLSLLAAVFPTLATAQTAPEVSTDHTVAIDSGLVANTNPSPAAVGIPAVVWSTVVSVPTSSWLRLKYSGILLSGSAEPGGDGSFLRITSMLDSQFQTQHLIHVEQWRETSAYLNGDSVLVELLACPGTGPNRLILSQVTAGPVAPDGTDDTCGPTDDRLPSSDPRIARLFPVGCTGWLINDCNHCFLTAGHCTGVSMQVAEFNVPLSTTGGGLRHPGPQDQYPVDFTSVQSNGGQGVGNDWAYFGVFANSNTGLTAHQANNGQDFSITSAPPAVGNQTIRITGYGTVSPPITPTWQQVQKTHAGPYSLFSGTTVQYVTDTSGGNSGSPVFLDGTNQAIGIHTHGGCAQTGANSGTGGNHPSLLTALANPTGICYCAPVSFAYPNGLPSKIPPVSGTVMRVQIGGTSPILPSSATLHISTGGPFQAIAATSVGGGLFEATLPMLNCQETVEYYWSVQDSATQTWTSPTGAPTSRHLTTVATSLATIRSHDFNTTPAGWTVVNTSLAAGAWTRGTPNDPGGPTLDYDGSGACYVTGNTSGEDVDGGPTRLLSETIDVSAANNAIVRYALWFNCSTTEDRLVVEATQNGGANWVQIEVLVPFFGWQLHGFRVLDHFPSHGNLQVRFSISDNPDNSITEAAVDAFAVYDATCPAPTWSAFGTGCSGSGPAPTLSLASLPALGGVFVLTTNNLGAGAPFMIAGFTGLTPAVSLTQYGFPAGCTLYVSPDAVFFLPGGVLGFAIPNDPAFSGIRLYNQVVELGGVTRVSDAGVGEIR